MKTRTGPAALPVIALFAGLALLAPAGSATPAAAAALCAPTPLSSCATSGRTRLSIADPVGNARNNISWRFMRGTGAPTQVAFGDPTADTSFALCIYDDSVLKVDVEVPPSAAKWQETARMTGYRYSDELGSAGGVKRMLLKSGADGRVRIIFRSRGPNVQLPAPAGSESFFNQSVSVVVQLVNDQGACWEATLTPVDTVINHTRRFKSVF